MNVRILLAGIVVASVGLCLADGDETTKAGHSLHGEAFNEGPRQAAYLMDGMPKAIARLCSTRD